MNASTRSVLEAVSVILTGILHLIFVEALNAKALFIAFALTAWTGYIALRVRKDRRLLGFWGFSRNNFQRTFTASSLIASAGVLVMAVTAVSRGSLPVHWHMLILFLLYPVWGVIQQFLVQALVAGNLSKGSGFSSSPWFVTVVCALLFAVVHLPDVTLAIGTLILGLAFTPIYLKWRNLWPLGLYHGWLGVFVYYWVLNRDPWTEVFGTL